jgi:ABC-type sugar transport system ATPase subunit
VRGLSRRGQFEGIDLEVRRGEVVGLTGLLGSGRTELALSLFGLNPADAGEVRVAGDKVRIGSVREAIALGIAYVPEDRAVQGLVLDHGVGWNLTLPRLRELTGRGGWLCGSRETEAVETGLREFGIRTAGRMMAARTLSGGNQQRLVLGKWLATNPRLLILDNPTVGVDVGAKRDLHRMIRQHAARGMGILLITDELPEVLAVTDRFYAMKGGRLAGEYVSENTSVEMVRALLEEAVE